MPMTHLSALAALTLDDFSLLQRVAELRNFSAVAREREVPPSQVSRALARIEARCGARLVQRSTHGLSLTDEGQTVVAHAERLMREAEQLAAALDERRQEPSGLVRVATSAVIAHTLAPCIGPLLDAYPRLRLEMAVNDRMVDMVRDGIDIAIRTGSPSSEGLVARRIATHARGLYAAPSYLQSHGTPATPAALAEHRLIGNSAAPALNRWPFKASSGLTDFQADGHLRTDSTANVLALCLAGVGIARLNDTVARPHLASGALLGVLDAEVVRGDNPIYAVTVPGRQRLPKLRVCIEQFAAWLGNGRLAEPVTVKPRAARAVR
jgi:DNA-binding transcriptional LysR family regulator